MSQLPGSPRQARVRCRWSGWPWRRWLANGRRRRALAYSAILALGLTATVHAQSGTFFNQRDDQYRLLGLKRAKDAFELARNKLERQQDLFDAGMTSQSRLDEVQREHSEAEVNYQQSLLAVLFEQQYVAVMGAVKYQAEDGRKHVRLRLENTSGGGAELAHLIDTEDALFRSLKPDVIHDVYVSLANDEGAIISQPYEAKLEELRYREAGTIDFALLQDVDAVTVRLAYGSSGQRSVKIFLQKDASVDRVVVQSEQFSQEVELGASASFDLTLELFSGRTDTYKLEVVGLPEQIHRYFEDPASGARLSQFKFTESTQTRRAALEVFLPDRDSEAVPINQPIPFWVLVVPQNRAASLEALIERKRGIAGGANVSAEEIAELDVGHVRLELVPRGVGRLRVKAPMLYFPTAAGEEVEVRLDVINEGTRRLDNVEVTADTPMLWTKRIDPPVIERLEIGEERTVSLLLSPPEGATIGKYETRIRTTSFSDNQPIEADDKTVSVEIQPEVRVAPSLILILLLIALVLGIVIFGVRLARR
ncbi:MAG: NEW3 domain-containing protein [Acidobacteriota bacterium]